MESIEIRDRVGCNVERARRNSDLLSINGIYRFSHYRGGILIDHRVDKNTVTTEGKSHLLSSAIDAATQKTAWYVALVSNAGPPPAPSAAHVYDTFFDSIVTEFSDYATTGIQRKAYTGVVTNGVITNIASKASFTINAATSDVYGAALVSNISQGDHTPGDFLMSWAGLTGGVLDVQVDDVLNIEIELAFS